MNSETPFISPIKKNFASNEKGNQSNNQSLFYLGLGTANKIQVGNKESFLNLNTSRTKENAPLLTDSTVMNENTNAYSNFKKLCNQNEKKGLHKQNISANFQILTQTHVEGMLKARNNKNASHSSKYIISESAKENIKEFAEVKFSEALTMKEGNSSPNRIETKDILDQEMKFSEELRQIESQKEDESLTTILYDNLDNIELGIGFFTFLTIISAIFSHDYQLRIDYYLDDPNFDYQNKGKSLEAALKTCLAVCSLSVLFNIIITILRYYIKYQIYKSTKQLMQSDNFFNNMNFVYLIIEIIVALIHPNLAFKDFKFTTPKDWYLVAVPYRANDYLTLFTLYRVITVFRCIIIYTDFYNFRAYRVSKMFGSELTIIFALRSLYRMYPWRVVFCYAVTITCIVAYSLRIIEGPVWYVSSDVRSNLNDYRSYENCVWNTFVTMTTVGYGDYYAITNFGRLILIFNSILGSCLVSLTTVTVQNYMTLNREEEKALQQLERLSDKYTINQASAAQVKATWDYLKNKSKLAKLMKEGFNSDKQAEIKRVQLELKDAVIRRIQCKKHLRQLLHKFRNVHELPNEFDNIDSLIQSCETLVEAINTKIESGISSYNKIKNYLEVMDHKSSGGSSKQSSQIEENFVKKNEKKNEEKKKDYHCPGCTCMKHLPEIR